MSDHVTRIQKLAESSRNRRNMEKIQTELKLFLPEEGGELAVLAENFDTANEGIEELESMLDDRDYGAEDRDDKWYEATEALGQVAVGLDLLSCLGRDLEAEAEENTEPTA